MHRGLIRSIQCHCEHSYNCKVSCNSGTAPFFSVIDIINVGQWLAYHRYCLCVLMGNLPSSVASCGYHGNSHSVTFTNATGETKRLATKVFFKETDRHALLHKSSYHPKHTYRGLIKSQLIRFHRICTYPHNVDKATRILFTALRRRGYLQRFLREIKAEVKGIFQNNGE